MWGSVLFWTGRYMTFDFVPNFSLQMLQAGQEHENDWIFACA